MTTNVKTLNYFQRKARRFVKKYITLADELDNLIKSLKVNPKKGTSLGAGLYKIRLASKSKGKGKSGGFRVVTYYIEQNGDEEVVYLVTIYDKSEEATITKSELLSILQEAFDDENNE